MPEAMVSSLSPTTSERMRLMSLAGKALAANLPPLTRDRCLRTQLTSSMAAPDASSARVVSCFSPRDMSSAGRQKSDEPPPETRLMMSVS
jgi:hypothetical protein